VFRIDQQPLSAVVRIRRLGYLAVG
jgi:hypothetical protein